MEVLSILGGLACLLTFVAVVGHALWVVAARLFSSDTPAPPTVPQAAPPGSALSSTMPAQVCPRCGLPLKGQHCDVCDWPREGAKSEPRSLSALEALARQAATFNRLGLLDSQIHQNLSRLIADERQRLTTLSAAPPAAEIPIEAELVAAELVEAPQVPPIAPSQREFASLVPVSERARQYEARQETLVPELAAEPQEPKRAWTDWLAAFMEERNMRWGELVGGLLIVCCSVALVVSFWSEISERPWLKFVLFNGVTAGLFGLGFYSKHRWRLHTSSQGLLIIANLLVPLNFLAIAAFSSGPAANAPLTIAGEAISSVVFAALVYYAGRILIADGAAWLAAGVLVPSAAQLLVGRYADPQTALRVLAALAGVPLAAYLVINGWHIRRAAEELVIGERQVNTTFKFLGLTAFATLLPLGLLVLKTERPLDTLRELPMIVGLLGIAPLGAGLMLWQKLAGRQLATLRTAGVSVAVMGALLLVAGLVLGWPHPQAMLPSALIEFAVFTFVAWRFALPAAHLLAAGCIALAYLLGIYLADHRIGWTVDDPNTLVRVLVSGDTGSLLAPLVLAYVAAALGLARSATTRRILGGAVAGLAAVSVALVSRFGFGFEGDPIGAAPVYALYAAGCLAASARSRRASIAWLGSALLFAGVLQATVFRFGAQLELTEPALTSILLFATLTIAIAFATRYVRWAVADSPLGDVLRRSSFAGSVAAALWLSFSLAVESAGFQAGHWLWLSLVWLAIATATGWPLVWILLQVGLSLATVFGAATVLKGQPWFAESTRPWLDPRTLSAIGIALAALNLAWTAIRGACRRASEQTPERPWALRAQNLLATPWLIVDRLVTGGLVALTVAIGCYAALPGALLELSPPVASAALTDFEWLGIPHQHAAGWGGWLLLASVVVLLAAIVCESGSRDWFLCLILSASVAAPLAASRWEDEVAVASAWRWLAVGMLVMGSAAVWGRRWIARQASRLGWNHWPKSADVAGDVRTLVFILGLLPTIAVASYVTTHAVLTTQSVTGFTDDVYAVAIILALSALVVATVVAAGRGVGWRQSHTNSGAEQTLPLEGSSQISALALALIVAPLVAVIVHHVGIALAGYPILGPQPGSFFARMGAAGSYATPIVAAALVLVGYAVRERSSSFALAAGLALNLAATVAYLLADWPTTVSFDAPLWIRLAQLNAAMAAGCGLAWLATLAWIGRRRERHDAITTNTPFNIQLAIGPALWMLAIGWTWSELFWRPRGNLGQSPLMEPELADPWGCASIALVIASIGAASWLAARRVSLLFASAALVALVVFSATWLAPRDTGNWLCYNTLLVGHGAIALCLLALLAQERYGRQPLAGDCVAALHPEWVVLQATFVSALAARELDDSLWWPAGGFAFVGVLLAPALAWLCRQRRYLYLAAPLINLSGLLAWSALQRMHGVSEFVYANIILLALPVAPWLLIELRAIRSRPWETRWSVPPMHRLATCVALSVLALVVALGLWGDATGTSLPVPADALQWIALAATLAAALACLWDVAARDAIAGLYFLGIVACGMLLDNYDLAPSWLLWMGTMVTAAYAVLTSYLWSRREGLLAIAETLKIPRRQSGDLAGLNWLVPCNVALVAAVVAMACTVELTEDDVSLRVLASQAVLAQVVSLALLARGDRRGVLQRGALILGAVGAVLFGWAWLDIGVTLTPLNALATMAAALAVVATLYGFGLVKLLADDSDWLPQARRLTPWLAAACAAAIAATMTVEIWQFAQTGAVAMVWPAILAVALTLAGLFVAALAAAILPGRDPLGLSERGRTLYVYGAEVILALLCIHIRLTLPWLFSGFFQQFWPLIVVAIAFLGVGVAELCRRRGQHVLAEPLENTGALLPVLPVVGYWAGDSQVHYSLLLLCVGVLYAGLSIARRSFGFGILAALAANGGLWYFLQRQEGLGFLAHPQIWLIPPALCVLAAAYLNRRQLSETQMTSLRYICSMAIYVSSTADVFLNGVAQAPWLPLVLGALSLAGIAAGILLRVRAFLFLGTAFLGLALFTIIWHAAVDRDQTWIWYVSGLVAGVLIVAGFTLVEKKRQDVLAVLEKIKAWDG
jgi:hypothetical protein